MDARRMLLFAAAEGRHDWRCERGSRCVRPDRDGATGVLLLDDTLAPLIG